MNIYVDGASRFNNRKDIPREGSICVYPEGMEPTFLELGDKTNNEVEYLAVMSALSLARTFVDKLGLSSMETFTIFSDSQLVVNQVNGTWKAKKPEYVQAVHAIRLIMNDLGRRVTLKWVPRENNLAGKELERRAR